MQLLQDPNFSSKLNSSSRVLLRLDLNLPQDENGNFTDLFRLESSLPTLRFLLEKKCTIFILAHLGSPKGQKLPSLSLEPISKLLSQNLQHQVNFIPNPFDSKLKPNQQSRIFLLENLRFFSGEEQNSEQFAKDLIFATSSEYFIQDAFGVCHRPHASLVQLPKLLPSAAGLLLQKEIAGLAVSKSSILSLIIGGAKVESKLPVIKNFLDSANSILTGGVVANTFLKASGQNIAASLFSAENLSLAKTLLKKSKQKSNSLELPSDFIVAESPNSPNSRSSDSQILQDSEMILDLGPKTISMFIKKLHSAQTIIWAGTLGFAENPIFANSSQQTLDAILSLKSQNPKLKIIIGGGDTVDFIRSNLSSAALSKIDHISTGGGASLQFLSGQELPGISALNLSPNINSKPNFKSTPPILAVNLKANFNLQQAKAWLEEVLQSSSLTSKNLQFIISAPDLFLEEFSTHISKLKSGAKPNNPPKIYAEDISNLDSGSHTGEVSAQMLQNIASGTLLGHSERRINFGETNQMIYQKVQQALKNSLNLILCVGSKSKNSNQHQQEVYSQLTSILPLFNSANSKLLTIAYEPVFAIGSGDVPTTQFLKEQLKLIKLTLQDYGLESPVLYGGSVDDQNIQQFLNLKFDGVLVGSAALKTPILKNIGENLAA